MRKYGYLFALCCLVLSGFACDDQDRTPETNAPAAKVSCKPAIYYGCANASCPGVQAWQKCNDDGASYGPCLCPVSAPTPDAATLAPTPDAPAAIIITDAATPQPVPLQTPGSTTIQVAIDITYPPSPDLAAPANNQPCLTDGQYIPGQACSPLSGVSNGRLVCRSENGSFILRCENQGNPIVPISVPDAAVMNDSSIANTRDAAMPADSQPAPVCSEGQLDLDLGCVIAPTDGSIRTGYVGCKGGAWSTCVDINPPGNSAYCYGWRDKEIDENSACTPFQNCQDGKFICDGNTWEWSCQVVDNQYTPASCIKAALDGGTNRIDGSNGAGGRDGSIVDIAADRIGDNRGSGGSRADGSVKTDGRERDSSIGGSGGKDGSADANHEPKDAAMGEDIRNDSIPARDDAQPVPYASLGTISCTGNGSTITVTISASSGILEAASGALILASGQSDGSVDVPIPPDSVTAYSLGADVDDCWGPTDCFVQPVCTTADGGSECVASNATVVTWTDIPPTRFTPALRTTLNGGEKAYFDLRYWRIIGDGTCKRQGCFNEDHVQICEAGEVCVPLAPGDGDWGCIIDAL
jgi:hypothetical protein